MSEFTPEGGGDPRFESEEHVYGNLVDPEAIRCDGVDCVSPVLPGGAPKLIAGPTRFWPGTERDWPGQSTLAHRVA